ncbi:MAG: hypothetical protein WBD22_12745 [Pyrinomonadaceae bacterium]
MFFLIWGVIHDGYQEPWIPAGLGASIVLGFGVLLREVILRNARNRFVLEQRRLDRSLHAVQGHGADRVYPSKLTLEQNASLVRQIRSKSDAAKIFGNLSEGHREVAAMCREYLTVAARELSFAGPGSPRILALRKGMAMARECQRYHTLRWAEIESTGLTFAAKNSERFDDKVSFAQKALNIIDSAKTTYPDDPSLLESEIVIREFISSAKISDLMEHAERAAYHGNYDRAEGLYREALFQLEWEKGVNPEYRSLMERIENEIKRVRDLSQ